MNKYEVLKYLEYGLELAEECQVFNGGSANDGDIEIRGALQSAIKYIKQILTPISNDEVRKMLGGLEMIEGKDLYNGIHIEIKEGLSQYISQLESKVSKIEEITDYILVDYTRVDNKYQKLSDVANEIKQILKASDE